MWSHDCNDVSTQIEKRAYSVAFIRLHCKKKMIIISLNLRFSTLIPFRKYDLFGFFFESTSNAQLTEELFEQPNYADKNKNALNLYYICTQFYFLFCFWMMI